MEFKSKIMLHSFREVKCHQGYGGCKVSPSFPSFLFLILMKSMRRRIEFKISLHDPRDGEILRRFFGSC